MTNAEEQVHRFEIDSGFFLTENLSLGSACIH